MLTDMAWRIEYELDNSKTCYMEVSLLFVLAYECAMCTIQCR